MTDYFKEVELPSRGVFYDGNVPDGLVHVEPMGTKQDKMFASGKQGAVVLNKIFDDCLACPIPHQNLVLGDRLWVLINLRAVSFDRGALYDFPFRCEECGKKDTHNVNLLKLVVKYPPDDFSPSDLPFRVKLPLQEKEIGFRLLTGKDEDAVERYGQQVARNAPADAEEAKYVYRLARRITAIDGETVGIQECMRFVEELKGKDAQVIQYAIDDAEVGPELEIEPTCHHCGYLNDPVILPIKASFFRPKRHRPSDGDYIGTAMVFDEKP